jgi:indolepyruvate ferredoxin oxidoreductase
MNFPAQLSPITRPDYRLADNIWAENGAVFLTGTQALVRLLVMQRQRDQARGLNTQGFISGYRGSPLGMVDKAVWSAGVRLRETGIRFVPAINEELAATQVLGTQRVESDPERTTDGVFALWYGKGPGVDRAGDALKHGNAYGSSPRGGVLVVAGDDHGCVSSSMPHQSDQAFIAWSLPILQPADVAELLEFGLYGYELSRYSGAWVAMAALSEVVESGATVDLDTLRKLTSAWQNAEAVQRATGHRSPADGLHYRWPDLPSLRIESRLADKLEAVAAFARVNSVDRLLIESPAATVGIVTCGKAHHDLMEAFRRLAIAPEDLAHAGVRLFKVGLSFPLEPTRIKAFATNLREILIVEEKGAVVEAQLRELFYNAPPEARPVLLGKRDQAGQPLVPAVGELRPARLMAIIARWLVRQFPSNARFVASVQRARSLQPPELLSNEADALKRLPYFCPGCPHNTGTKVPEGSTARAGIGCHFMASWMDRATTGLIQMGGEGADWISHAMFTRTPHVFQNLGDGTYYHSGYLAIRQAVATQTSITYKILYNGAVAMTGGQPVDGGLSIESIACQVAAEGVRKVVVVSDDLRKYDTIRARFPAGTEFHDRARLDSVQRQLRDQSGVTVLIYDQACAAEKRRRRKRGESAEPLERLVINEAVCEGCGDCSVASNCVAVVPHDTAFGRKRRIDQTNCNRDFSCAQGFCPSFVSVTGATPRKRHAVDAHENQEILALAAALSAPIPHEWTGPFDVLVTGAGGTGVVTVGAILAMAAHLEGKSARTLDFMGFAQKGGSVLSFVRLASRAQDLNQARIDVQQADTIVACDLVVGASSEVLQTVRRGFTRIVANLHEIPLGTTQRDPDARTSIDQLLARLRFAAGEDRIDSLDAQYLAQEFLGDTVSANVVALGYAWQRGLLPISAEAIDRAIELNNAAVPENRLAFALGRLAADETAGLQRLRSARGAAASDDSYHEPLEALIARAANHLQAYQGRDWAAHFEARVDAVRRREQALADSDAALPLTRNFARSLLKLMSYKDEYEVARLHTNGEFAQWLEQHFAGDLRLEFHLAPPWLARPRRGRPPRKFRIGPWILPVMRVLARGKVLRGTWLDVFGYTKERRLERELIVQFEHLVDRLLHDLSPANRMLAAQIAALPLTVRGFGHVKLANLALARAREAELLHRFSPHRYARPDAAPAARQIRGIAVVTR